MTTAQIDTLLAAMAQLGAELAAASARVETITIEAGPDHYAAFVRAMMHGLPPAADLLASAEEMEFRFPPLAHFVVRLRKPTGGPLTSRRHVRWVRRGSQPPEPPRPPKRCIICGGPQTVLLDGREYVYMTPRGAMPFCIVCHDKASYDTTHAERARQARIVAEAMR